MQINSAVPPEANKTSLKKTTSSAPHELCSTSVAMEIGSCMQRPCEAGVNRFGMRYGPLSLCVLPRAQLPSRLLGVTHANWPHSLDHS